MHSHVVSSFGLRHCRADTRAMTAKLDSARRQLTWFAAAFSLTGAATPVSPRPVTCPLPAFTSSTTSGTVVSWATMMPWRQHSTPTPDRSSPCSSSSSSCSCASTVQESQSRDYLLSALAASSVGSTSACSGSDSGAKTGGGVVDVVVVIVNVARTDSTSCMTKGNAAFRSAEKGIDRTASNALCPSPLPGPELLWWWLSCSRSQRTRPPGDEVSSFPIRLIRTSSSGNSATTRLPATHPVRVQCKFTRPDLASVLSRTLLDPLLGRKTHVLA